METFVNYWNKIVFGGNFRVLHLKLIKLNTRKRLVVQRWKYSRSWMLATLLIFSRFSLRILSRTHRNRSLRLNYTVILSANLITWRNQLMHMMKCEKINKYYRRFLLLAQTNIYHFLYLWEILWHALDSFRDKRHSPMLFFLLLNQILLRASPKSLRMDVHNIWIVQLNCFLCSSEGH